MTAALRRTLSSFAKTYPGVGLTLIVAIVAAFLGDRFPVIGGAVFGVVLGLLIRAAGFVGHQHQPGIRFSAKQLLQTSVVLLGASLSLGQIVTTGLSSLTVMLSTLGICLLAAWGLGRWFDIERPLYIMIGVGTAICGASAIAAVSPAIEADEQDVAYSVSTIFLYNVAAVLAFPLIGRWLGLDQAAFGLWAGTAINDTSSVVAAAHSYGAEAVGVATVVKLTRSTMIIPVTLAIAIWQVALQKQQQTAANRIRWTGLIPWFIVWFLLAALLNSAGLVPAGAAQTANSVAKFLIVHALAAVGLSADFRKLKSTGLKPALLGLMLWTTVAVTALVVQRYTGQL